LHVLNSHCIFGKRQTICTYTCVYCVFITTHSVSFLYLLSAGEDYTPAIDTLTFPSAPSRVYVNITILNDDTVEQQEETFGVRLSADDQCVSLTEDEATVTINDETSKESNSYFDI